MTSANRKRIFSRIGDGLVSGVGVLIVGALGGFVWYEYTDTLELLGTTIDELNITKDELNITKEAFNQQTEINAKLGDRLEQVQAVASSLVELAKQDGPDRGLEQSDFENSEELLSETSLLPAGVEDDLNSLIGEQAELLTQLPTSN